MAVALPEVPVEGQAPPPPAPPAPVLLSTEPGRVAVTRDGSDIQTLPLEQLEDARAQQYRPATATEIYNARTGTMGKVLATTDAITRGATFGLSDAAQVGIAGLIGGDAARESVREQMRMAKEGNPELALAGEIGGSLAGLLLVPGGGAAKAAAGAEGLFARGAARFAGAAPRLMAEGAAMSAGQQFSEDTLGNHDAVAQKYIAAAGKGALLNLVLGGALHAGGGAIGDRLFTKAATVAEEGAVTAGRKSLGERISSFAEERAFKGTGAKMADYRALGATAEAQTTKVQRIGRTLLDEGVITPGATLGKQAERLSKRLGEVGEDLGAIRKTLDTSVVRPSAEIVARRIHEEVVLPLMDTPFSGASQNAIRPLVAEIIEHTQGRTTFDTFADLFKLRRSLGDSIKKTFARPKDLPPLPGEAEALKIHGILEEVFEEGAERAAKDLGDDVATKYLAKKAVYHDLATAENIVSREVARGAANRTISLTDTIAGAGALTAALAGHPMALLAPVANKLVRTLGDQVAASALNRVSKLEMLQRAQEKFDGKLATSVESFFTKKGAKSAEKGPERMTPAQLRAVRAAVKDPVLLSDRATEAVTRTGLDKDAPNVSRAMVATITRAATYIQNRLPPEPAPKGIAFGPTEPRPLGRRAQAEVNNAIRALDTEALLDDIARGHLDRQQIEAVKIINPQLYGEIQGAVERYVVENRPETTRQQQVALSIITGKPLGAMMQPKTIRGFQEAHTTGAPSDPTQAGVTQPTTMGNAARTASRKAETMASGTDRLEDPNAM